MIEGKNFMHFISKKCRNDISSIAWGLALNNVLESGVQGLVVVPLLVNLWPNLVVSSSDLDDKLQIVHP
jgi:hypothetical protein